MYFLGPRRYLYVKSDSSSLTIKVRLCERKLFKLIAAATAKATTTVTTMPKFRRCSRE
jgi:hypothetical protein